MSDPVVFTEGGRTYRVYGVDDRISAIDTASTNLADLIADREKRGGEALDAWRGPHAGTFALDLNTLLADLSRLRIQMRSAALALRYIPDAPSEYTLSMLGREGSGAWVPVPDADGSVSATTRLLRDFVDAAAEGDPTLVTAAGSVTTSGMWADVTFDRPLTASERQAELDGGATPQQVDMMSRSETDLVSIDDIVVLPDLFDEAAACRATSSQLNEFTSAVASAIDAADGGLLDLLAEYPELAGYVVPGGPEGSVRGEAALAILLQHFDELDIAKDGENPDGRVSDEDLEAAAGDESRSDMLRAAAQYLLDNSTMLDRLDTIRTRHDRPNGTFDREDLEVFIEMNDAMTDLWAERDAIDTAAHGGDGDGTISVDDLEAAAADSSLPASVRAAAQWFLDHDVQRSKLYAQDHDGVHARGEFTIEGLAGRIIDHQSVAHDPSEARRFVLDLPVAGMDGGGLPVGLASDDGVMALANAALIDAAGDLTDQHGVISHLPETHGAVRNQLITAHYAVMAHEMDAILAGDLAGYPELDGHPGANWMMMAPWASDSVGAPIRGDIPFSFLSGPFVGEGVAQAAADGNQWIYSDIGERYAGFIELYRDHPNPTPQQLEGFFSQYFDDGDATIRSGFAGYVAAINTDDPAARQRLTFQANSFIAIHEQAGVQHHLEDISVGPDGVAVAYVDLYIDGRRFDADIDLEALNSPNNHVAEADILDLDPGGMGPEDFSVPGVVDFQVGGSGNDAVNLAEMDGVESWAPDFPRSIEEFHEGGAGVVEYVPTYGPGGPVAVEDTNPDPDDLEGSGANSWPDRTERMWYITRLFEQTHTDQRLWNTGSVDFGSTRLDWVDPATGLR